MNRKLLVLFLILAGFVQSLSYNLFHAPSFFLTHQEFTIKEYGFFILPMAISSAIFAWMGGNYAQKRGLYTLFMTGSLFNILTFFLLVAATISSPIPWLSLLFFMISMFLFGISYVATMITVVTLVFKLFPKKTEIFMCLFFIPFSFGEIFEFEQFWIPGFFLLLGVISLMLLFDLADIYVPLEPSKEQEKRSWPKILGFLLFSALCAGIFEVNIIHRISIFVIQSEGKGLGNFLWVPWVSLVLGNALGAFLLNWISAKWLYAFLPLPSLIAALFLDQVSLGINIFLLIILGISSALLLPLAMFLGQKYSLGLEVKSAGRVESLFSAGYVIMGCFFAFFGHIGAGGTAEKFWLIAVSLGLLVVNSLILRRSGSLESV